MHCALQAIVAEHRRASPQPNMRKACSVCRRLHKNKYSNCVHALGEFVMEFFDQALTGVDKFGTGPICGWCVSSLCNTLFFRYFYSIPYDSRHYLREPQKKDAEYLILEWLAEKLKNNATKAG